MNMWLAVARRCPSGLKSRSVTGSSWPSNVRCRSPLVVSHSSTLRPAPAASNFPSGLKVTLLTWSPWPSSVWSNWPDAISQISTSCFWSRFWRKDYQENLYWFTCRCTNNRGSIWTQAGIKQNHCKSSEWISFWYEKKLSYDHDK